MLSPRRPSDSDTASFRARWSRVCLLFIGNTDQRTMTSSVRRSYGVFGNLEKSLELHQQQLAPFELYKDNSLDGMLRFCPKIGCSNLLQRIGTRISFFYRGLATQPAQNMDTSISKQVTPNVSCVSVCNFHAIMLVYSYFCLPRSGQAYELLTLRRLAVMQPFLQDKTITAKHKTLQICKNRDT